MTTKKPPGMIVTILPIRDGKFVWVTGELSDPEYKHGWHDMHGPFDTLEECKKDAQEVFEADNPGYSAILTIKPWSH
jgi:hypothetical protein